MPGPQGPSPLNCGGPGPNWGPPIGPGPDMGPQLELGGRKLLGAERGPQFIEGGAAETTGPPGPSPQGPGVLEPEFPEGLLWLTKPCGPEPGPQGTRGGGGPPPGVVGGPGEGPW